MWIEEEIKNLNDFQAVGYYHPFTCPTKSGEKHDLVATKDGWICPACSGDEIVQTWAHEWMINGEWKKSSTELEKLYCNPHVQKLLAGLSNTEEKR